MLINNNKSLIIDESLLSKTLLKSFIDSTITIVSEIVLANEVIIYNVSKVVS